MYRTKKVNLMKFKLIAATKRPGSTCDTDIGRVALA